MSLIEKAIERLDQLKQAGATVPDEGQQGAAGAQDATAVPPPVAAEVMRPSVAQPVEVPVSSETAQGASTAMVNKGESAAGVTEAPSPKAPEPQRARTSKQLTIDLARLAAMGMVTPDKPRSALAEQYRVIKRPLIRNFRGGGAAPVAYGNLIMVTSSMPGEGKSFSSINLAISLAMELDFTVLLVDADFSKPTVLNRLGLSAEKGLLDVLQGEVDDLGDVIARTNIDKLSILPAGRPHPRATELIASTAMAQLLEEMSSRYHDRIIVFDSPPLLATTEARVLASHMGQIVMVVEADRTTHSAVRQALSTIELCPVKLLLLNKVSGARGGDLYGYGYGYGYAYGSEG